MRIPKKETILHLIDTAQHIKNGNIAQIYKEKGSRNEMSQKSLWAKFPRAIYAFLLGLLDGKAASFTEYTL